MRRTARIVTAVMAVLVIFGPVALLATGSRAVSFENRRLATFPPISDGWGAFTELPGWANDQLPLRDRALRWAQAIDENVFGDPLGGATIPLVDGYPAVIIGRHGLWFYGADIQYRCQPTRTPEALVAGLAELNEAVTASGRQFIVVAAPDKSTILPDELPDDYFGRECAYRTQQQSWALLSGQPWMLDLRPALTAAVPTASPSLYLDKDTHWDGAGAAIMVHELVSRIEPAVAETFTAQPQQSWTKTADLSVLIGKSLPVTVHPVELVDPRVRHDYQAATPDIFVPQHYSSSGPAGTIVTAKTVMVCDSFTLAAGSALPNVFADVTEIHQKVAATDPGLVIQQMVDAQVVVLAVAERDLLGGAVPLLTPENLAAAAAALAAAPWS